MTSRSVLALLALVVAFPAALPAQTEGNGPQFFIVPSKPPSNAPRWGSSVREAFEEAKRSGRPLMVDLFAEWCGWCKVMEAKTFATPQFLELAKGYVLLRVDVEDGGEGSDLSARYGSESLPTLLLIEPSGGLIGEIRGFRPAEEVEAEAKALAATHAKSIEYYETLRTSSDVEALRSLAGGLYARRDSARAAVLFQRVIEVEPSSGDDAAWLRFFLADSLRGAGRYADAKVALASARPLLTESSDVELRERLELLPFWIAKDAAHCADASGALAEFERGHPESVFLPEAKRALGALRGGNTTCS